ncbi:hypothetical protein J2T60_001172 [Natronospira proteinivora]|uniref:Uncharacterized protein n=1 Tax=Natronospira proteinivora TaxID=1807133 RepID=A0ABT1GBC1_9GAMM|nr:hypothetical protein [Natronospira proteinivora]MCP1727207.1 hypothetical protein [Natronospira proteinivora]
MTFMRLFLFAIFTASLNAQAHEPVEMDTERFSADTRLFISDNANHQIIVMDLPAGEEVTRISVPPQVMSMGVTESGQYLLATRGRDTDRQYLTVVDTGLNDSGDWTFPVVSKTLLLGESISSVRTSGVQTLRGQHLLAAEAQGRLIHFDESVLAAERVFEYSSTDVHPDHLHIVELEDEALLVGMTRHGEVRHKDADGNVLARHDCPGAHGSYRHGERSFFGCRNSILVFSGHEKLERVSVPDEQARAASFYPGGGRLWGGSESFNGLVWIDPDSLEIGVYEAADRVERHNTSPDGELLAMLLGNGELHLHDAATGEHRYHLELAEEVPAMTRSTAGASAPGVEFSGDKLLVSLPASGDVYVIDVAGEPEILHHWQLDGRPTRIVPISNAQ